MSLTARRATMARKRYKAEEIVAKLRQVDVLTSQGQSMADAIRQIGVSEATYYRWRQEFGGLKIEQVKRLKCCPSRPRNRSLASFSSPRQQPAHHSLVRVTSAWLKFVLFDRLLCEVYSLLSRLPLVLRKRHP